MGSEAEADTHTIDRTPEYNEFIEKLRAYHEKRGTTFDPEPKISNTPLDLLKVFKAVVERGGYDQVTEGQMGWRRVREELAIPTTNAGSAAYSLKDKFYKNLAAYEISTVHNKEPPPKDILEDVTAKGGDLLSRTRENFRGGKHKANAGEDSSASGDDGTPSREPTATEGTPVSSLRASRGLREAPPQRVIFQPDTAPSRTRNASGAHAATPGHDNQAAAQSPAAYTNSPSVMSGQISNTPVPLPHQARAQRGPSSSFTPQNSENVASAVDSYQPRILQQSTGIPLRPVETPSTNPAEFARRAQAARQAAAPAPLHPSTPGLGKQGPNIYHTCIMALLSRIPAQQAYALHHLVKISFERGDKFMLYQFPGLAEALIEKILEVGSLFYEVKWEVVFTCQNDDSIGMLDNEYGTPDILQRIDSLKRKPFSDLVLPAATADAMVCINEAALTLRNMVNLPENAKWISELPVLKAAICVVLQLPNNDCVIELKHLVLEIAEEITRYMELDSEDPLYQALMAQLDSEDRGMVVLSLRALGRISTNLETANRLDDVPGKVLQSVSDLLLLNDDELTNACLDFLYQYTAVVSNVDNLLRSIEPIDLVTQLVRLLSHGGRRFKHVETVSDQQTAPLTDQPAPVPSTLLEDLLKMKEPDRCQQWVRCFFEQDKDSFVTQITAWQAYQNAFLEPLKKAEQSLITPADFIRNSTNVYKESKAEVLRPNGPGDTQQKFIIQGIRAREHPVGVDGTHYRRCAWKLPTGQVCGEYCAGRQSIVHHALQSHLNQAPGEDGKWSNVEVEFVCRWSECDRFRSPERMSAWSVAHHLSTHAAQIFPREDATNFQPPPQQLSPRIIRTRTFEETAVERDERNANGAWQAAGIPVPAALILRNIARNAPKTQSDEELRKSAGRENDGWNERLFRLMRPRLSEIMAENRALAPYVSSILDLVFMDTDV